MVNKENSHIKTLIQVDKTTATRIKELKITPAESYSEILTRILPTKLTNQPSP